jgi:hypothetical protein
MDKGYSVKDRRRAAKNRDFLKSITEDLAYLRTEWDNKISDAALRRGSVVLVRLLVDEDFLRAWSIMRLDGQPEIAATSLVPMVAEVPLDKVEFASAGGARYGTVLIQGVLVANMVVSRASKLRLSALLKEGLPRETMRFRPFLRSSCLVVNGEHVSRHALINYVANKRGGKHYDPRRSGEAREFELLDSIGYEVAGKPAVYFELLAVGQTLAAAPSTIALQAAIDEYLG